MLPPYKFYWFRIHNKPMTEPWLNQALMDYRSGPFIKYLFTSFSLWVLTGRIPAWADNLSSDFWQVEFQLDQIFVKRFLTGRIPAWSHICQASVVRSNSGLIRYLSSECWYIEFAVNSTCQQSKGCRLSDKNRLEFCQLRY